MKNLRVKIWAVCCAVVFLATVFPAVERVTVLLTYGWSGYSAGIRIAQVKPLRFTNGESVPADKASSAIPIVVFGMFAIFLVPVLGLPPALRLARRLTAKRTCS